MCRKIISPENSLKIAGVRWDVGLTRSPKWYLSPEESYPGMCR